jgi:hypothetical protein
MPHSGLRYRGGAGRGAWSRAYRGVGQRDMQDPANELPRKGHLRSSENSVKAKFAEFTFHALRCMAFSLLRFCIIDTIGN